MTEQPTAAWRDPCRAEFSFRDHRFLLFVPLMLLFPPAVVIVVSGIPAATHIAALVLYTIMVFIYTFCHQRDGRRYLFKCPAVRRQLLRLAKRHLGFLSVVLVIVTATVYLYPRLPGVWLTERGPKHDTLFQWALIIVGVALVATQVITNRSLLERAHLEFTNLKR